MGSISSALALKYARPFVLCWKHYMFPHTQPRKRGLEIVWKDNELCVAERNGLFSGGMPPSL